MFQYVIMSNHLKIPLIIITIALRPLLLLLRWDGFYLYLSSI